MQVDSDSREKIILIVGFIVLAIIIALATYGFTISSQENSGTEKSSDFVVDKKTGLTVDTNTERSPETVGENPSSPVLINFDLPIKNGLSEEDVSKLKNGISDYIMSNTSYKPASIVSISDMSCKLPDTQGFITCSYVITVNSDTSLEGTFRSDRSGPVAITLSSSESVVYNKTL